MFGNYLQQTTSADGILKLFFAGVLRVKTDGLENNQNFILNIFVYLNT